MKKIQTNMRLDKETKQIIKECRKIMKSKSDAAVVAAAMPLLKTQLLTEMVNASLDQRPIIK